MRAWARIGRIVAWVVPLVVMTAVVVVGGLVIFTDWVGINWLWLSLLLVVATSSVVLIDMPGRPSWSEEPTDESDDGQALDGEKSAVWTEFDDVVQRALDALPDKLARQASNLTIVVEDEPPAGTDRLGFYEGAPLNVHGRSYRVLLPDKITIYRGPLERLCANDPERLEEEVKRTLWHEVAHHFGISDERLIEIDRY